MIPDRFDTALAALVTPLATNFNVYTAKSSDEKQLPCVVCSSDLQGEEDPPGTGNWQIQATIAIKQSAVQDEYGADDAQAGPDATAKAASSAIIAGIMATDLAAQITTAATALTVFNGSVVFLNMESGVDETGLWVDTLTFRCYVCGSKLG